jgi:hypothetical protein
MVATLLLLDSLTWRGTGADGCAARVDWDARLVLTYRPYAKRV